MRKAILSCFFILSGMATYAQQFCDPNGNLIIYSNYDGGPLTINVDVNIPNLKIGVVSYEATHVIITGTYASNVTDVAWAGYNATNNHCGFAGTTQITSTGSNNTIAVLPPATLSNVYGNASIIYSYACDNTSTNPGGNTPDQVEHYFLSMFSGSTVRYHKSQYGCWGNSELVSAGGNCCGTVQSLTAGATFTAPTCNGGCNGSVTGTGGGGTPPYTYQWAGGPATATWSNLCAGTYTVTVTDANNATDTQSVTVTQPALLASSITQTACMSYTFNSTTYNSSGVYHDTLTSTGGCDSVITLNLTIGTGVNSTTTLNAGTLTSGQANGTYQWVNCPNYTPIAGATAQSYTPTSSGNYAVIVSYQGCPDTSNCVNVIPSSVGHIASSAEFNIYPNPAHSEVFIEGSLEGQYRITDQVGRVVLQGEHKGNKTTVSLRDMPAGLYFIDMNGLQPVKLLKQ